MDEPASALDPIATTRIEDLMHELKRDYTIVVVTHNMQQAARIADMTAFFSITRGRGRAPVRRARRVRRHEDDLHAAEGQANRGLRHRPLRLTRFPKWLRSCNELVRPEQCPRRRANSRPRCASCSSPTVRVRRTSDSSRLRRAASTFELLSPTAAIGSLEPGDAALARLDVLPTVDGIEPGIWQVGRLEAEGIRVLNGLRTLLATHDKLQTSRVLAAAGLPHPSHDARRRSTRPARARASGRRQTPLRQLGQGRAALRERGRVEGCARGALEKAVVPPAGRPRPGAHPAARSRPAHRRRSRSDRRRDPATHRPGRMADECGSRRAARLPTDPPQAARELALAAAAAAEGDLVGIDLMPTARRWLGRDRDERRGRVHGRVLPRAQRLLRCGRSPRRTRSPPSRADAAGRARLARNLLATASSPARRPSSAAGRGDWIR